MFLPPKLLLCILLPGSALLCGCNGESCIKPPPLKSEADRKAAVTLAAELEKLNVDAKIQTDFGKVVNTAFDKLSEDNMTLYLLLSSIECYLKHGKIGQEVAKEMAQLVRTRWAAKAGLMGAADNRLTPRERDLIGQSGDMAPKILEQFNRIGIQ